MSASEKKILTVLENERRYVARELHDGVAQTTLQLGLEITICRKLLERGNVDMLAEELAQLEQRIQHTSTQVRELIADMRPPTLESDSALRDYIQAEIERHIQRGGVPVEFEFGWSQVDLTAEQKLALSRIVQEALLNVRKHARADQVQISCTLEPDQAELKIVDNGQGFDFGDVQSRSEEKRRAGLVNMEARAEAVGGTLTIHNPESGGTKVAVKLNR